GWNKLTNNSAHDWTDLHNFLSVMRTPTGPGYLDQINSVMDIDQWLRSLAVNAVLTNGENSLPTGVDDDYSIYRTATGAFQLVPHDLDTILGLGDSSAIEEDDLPYTVIHQKRYQIVHGRPPRRHPFPDRPSAHRGQ
ncbi:MAG: CotH kinase family protein, partial [Verrucomicrobiales bacterium]|nr:CotH kinase family protein [Verrucomicrobiales bacterium]